LVRNRRIERLCAYCTSWILMYAEVAVLLPHRRYYNSSTFLFVKAERSELCIAFTNKKWNVQW